MWCSIGVYVLGWTVYVLLGSGREQPWNTPYETLLAPVDIPREHEPVMPKIRSINNADNDLDSSHPS